MPLTRTGSVKAHTAAVIEHVRDVAREEVNATVDAARDDAAASHIWANRTGQLEEEIVSKHAEPGETNPTASFGTTRRRGFVGLFHEQGTKYEIERPFLRPAADRNFPSLAERIKERLRR